MTADRTPRQQQERKRDKAVEDSFPASDPPANTGIVGPGSPSDTAPDPHRAPDRRGDDERPTGHPTSDRHKTETAFVWEHEDVPPTKR